MVSVALLLLPLGIWEAAYEKLTEAERIAEMNRLIAEWREPGFISIRPRAIIPDVTNREGTGVSSKHLHYIATAMQSEGFTPRDDATSTGHDLPILVREVAGSETPLGEKSLTMWRRYQGISPELPPTLRDLRDGDEFYCSLGSGHFFQALNLFGSAHPMLFRRDREARGAPERYAIGQDAGLRAAVEDGVRSVVLRDGIGRAERKFLCQMLNAAYEYRWVVGPGGAVHVDLEQTVRAFTSYDGLTKHADAWQLDELVTMRVRKLQARAAERAAAAEAAASRPMAVFSREEIRKHNTKDDLWVVIDGTVYDMTEFLPDHPGDANAPVFVSGRDASKEFHLIHRPELLERYGRPYMIGTVAATHDEL